MNYNTNYHTTKNERDQRESWIRSDETIVNGRIERRHVERTR